MIGNRVRSGGVWMSMHRPLAILSVLALAGCGADAAPSAISESAAEAEPYSGKLLPLPAFVREGGRASWPEIAAGLDLTGHFLFAAGGRREPH